MRSLFSLLIAVLVLVGCNAQKAQMKSDAVEMNNPEKAAFAKKASTIVKIEKSEAEWKKELSDEEYYILREKGTERAHTGDLLHNKKKGTYTCAACELPLFDSSTKFESGTGWPSFYAPVASENVGELEDRKYGMVRTEVVCGRCDGHLGHVFNDGPKPTGLRYCMNSVSLDFVEEEKKQ